MKYSETSENHKHRIESLFKVERSEGESGQVPLFIFTFLATKTLFFSNSRCKPDYSSNLNPKLIDFPNLDPKQNRKP